MPVPDSSIHPTGRDGPSQNMPQNQRKLRAHKKSRRGCKNCKLRKIKCDERQPSCLKCESYDIRCNYSDSHCSDLQLAAGEANEDVGTLRVLPRSRTSEVTFPSRPSDGATILAHINNHSTDLMHGNVARYQFSIEDLKTLHRFQSRTQPTLGSRSRRNGKDIYRNAFAKLTYTHPFLMHIVLTVTLTHDTYLNYPQTPSESAAHATSLALHWSTGAALLNDKLSRPIIYSERDALWACAGLLGTLAFSSLTARTPEEAWPLKPSTSCLLPYGDTDPDLDWLKLTEGKKAVFKVVDPLRPDSLFNEMGREVDFSFLKANGDPSLTTADMEFLLSRLPADLITLCGITAASTPKNNDYLAPASALALGMQQSPTGNETFILFLRFLSAMGEGFKTLLAAKDPAAMVMFAMWYARIAGIGQWWVLRRALLECEAICLYLERWCMTGDGVLEGLVAITRVLCEDSVFSCGEGLEMLLEGRPPDYRAIEPYEGRVWSESF